MAIAAKRMLTSGDLVADRRADYAAMLAEGRDNTAAAELMEQALELAPAWAAGWFRLGEYREKAGLPDAIAAYRRTLELAPDDIFGASLKVKLLSGGDQSGLPPSRYVEGLFDDYADRFDTALVERLGYSVPGKLMRLIHAHVPGPYGHVVDLGCGTGLFGAEIAGRCDMLEGYDLSANMLAKAEAKSLYDYLARADLSLAPDKSGLFSNHAEHRADLVVAADVMMYLGDLGAALANAAAVLKPAGVFAFSVEKSGLDTGFELRPSLRYAHTAVHVGEVLAMHDLQPFASEETVIRTDAGAPITGLLFLARAADVRGAALPQ
jgi:predicted TPR repeat methyltransferase